MTENRRWRRWLIQAIVVGLVLMVAGQSMMRSTQAAPSDEPEDIITGFSPSAMAYNGAKLIVASSGYSMESCGFNPALETPVLRVMNPDGSDVEVMLERCVFVQKGMVADEDHVYFRDGDDIIKRSEIPGNGSLSFLAADTCCGGLAIDETHVYWGKWVGADNEIWRYDKVANTSALVATVPDPNNYDIHKLALDDTHVYWTGGSLSGGVIQRVPKAGGVVETLANTADGIENARGITVDDTHVYWTELAEGRMRRVAKGGGAITDYAVDQGSYQGGAIAVNNSHIFWSDTTGGYDGRIRRIAKNGVTADDIALGQLGPGGLLLIDNYIYWGRHGGVRRLPIDADLVTIDLAIENIEVTQAVQSFDNDVPLVADKRAIVRVYPRIVETQGELTGVSAKAGLRVFQNGMELTTVPIRPINETVHVRTFETQRDQLENSFNFIVPYNWRTAGTYEFRAEIEAASNTVVETSMANNERSVTVTFNQKKPLCVEMVSVRTSPDTYHAFDPGWNETLDWLEASFPIPNVLIDVGGTIEEVIGGPAYEMPGDDNKVLSRLGWYDFWHAHNAASSCGGKAHFYGMIHPDKNVGGLGRRPGWQAWGTMDPSSSAGNANPWFNPFSGAVLAHELGHNRGRKHVDCGNPDDPDQSYPWNPCNMGPVFSQAEWFGYDIFDEVAIHPAAAGDLMSYAHLNGKPLWPSDYTYKALYNDLPNAAVAAAAAPVDAASQLALDVTTADEVIALSAFISPTLTSATFDSGYRVGNGLVSPEKLAKMTEMILPNRNGPFHLQQLGAEGKLLADFPFDLTDIDGPEDGDIPVMIVVPFIAGTTDYVLLHETIELARRSVSRSVPEVEVITPNGGEGFENIFTIEWKADDADGDPLRYTVQFSADNGSTWSVVATDLVTPSIEVDETFNLPGTYNQALVRVIATDGTNSASDVSDGTFSLLPRAPRGFISQPSDGEVFGYGEQITLAGRGFDIEDGMLKNEQLAWQIDGQMVGFGREVVLDSLDIGEHTVTLWALDTHQLSDRQEITIHVRRQYCVPEHNQMQVVFILDASPQMHGYHGAACDAIDQAKQDWVEMGLEAEVAVYGTTAPLQCAATTIPALDSATAVNHPADWGPAITSVANRYPWQSNAVRMIVPISSQGPDDGYPIDDPGADRDAIDTAIVAANNAGIAVSPVIIPETFGPFTVLQDLAGELAQATAGTAIPWAQGQPLELAETLQEVQAKLSCDPKADQATPARVESRAQEVAITGLNLWPGTAVYLDEQRINEVTFSPDGTAVRFPLPAEFEDGTYDLRVVGVATGEVILSGAVTLDPEPKGLDSPLDINVFLPLVQR